MSGNLEPEVVAVDLAYCSLGAEDSDQSWEIPSGMPSWMEVVRVDRTARAQRLAKEQARLNAASSRLVHASKVNCVNG